MGNGVAKLSHCFSGGGGGGSARRRRRDAAALPPLMEPYEEGLGHSFCYVRPETSAAGGAPASSAKVHHHQTTSDESATTFRSISGASVSANASTPLSTSLLNELTWPAAAAAFESSVSFASVPLHPIPDSQGFLSGPIERGFMSGPLTDARLFSGPLPARPPAGLLRRSLSHAPRPRRAAASLLRGITKAIARTSAWHSSLLVKPKSDSSTTSSGAAADDSDTPSSDNLHWAQGKAGEDRVHVVISEEYGWVFVGIYDGFNGPDATDYLLTNLYPALHRHLKGLLWDDAPHPLEESDPSKSTSKKWEWDKEQPSWSSSGGAANHGEVLDALSVALRKTEEAYLDVADKMASENPELALMGSCVLVMLMKGEDVYLMNVGDSRGILARKDSDLARQDLERIREEGSHDLELYYSDDQTGAPCLAALQLTLDHSTCIEEEVVRIKKEHPDDASAIANDRVKGSLKVTRAFGAGFLKQPKWNDALLEVFRIDYVGTSPYITCNPSLYHHKLGPKDRFLILSSDGLYQYFTNEEAVSQVELFIATTPEGDPAQHLVEEVLFRAANKAGMDFHELLEIPQGDRRRYHDDVSIIVISLEGRIWRSCV